MALGDAAALDVDRAAAMALAVLALVGANRDPAAALALVVMHRGVVPAEQLALAGPLRKEAARLLGRHRLRGAARGRRQAQARRRRRGRRFRPGLDGGEQVLDLGRALA